MDHMEQLDSTFNLVIHHQVVWKPADGPDASRYKPCLSQLEGAADRRCVVKEPKRLIDGSNKSIRAGGTLNRDIRRGLDDLVFGLRGAPDHPAFLRFIAAARS